MSGRSRKFGCRHGKVVRCMGKVRVNALKEEVTTLKGQLAAQGEHMSIIVWALQMFDLQISMPAPNLAPPSTSQPLRPANTQ
ncbi:unnamed protein product [Malus baccata var. baccata]